MNGFITIYNANGISFELDASLIQSKYWISTFQMVLELSNGYTLLCLMSRADYEAACKRIH